MVNAVKQGYTNPLAMMKQGKQKNHFQAGTISAAEKRQKSLEAEKQSIENAILLMKGTSGDSGASRENIEVLEKKLEEVTEQVRAGEQKIPISQQRNFDSYSKEESEEADGQYRVLKEREGYKIVYNGIEEH